MVNVMMKVINVVKFVKSGSSGMYPYSVPVVDKDYEPNLDTKVH